MILSRKRWFITQRHTSTCMPPSFFRAAPNDNIQGDLATYAAELPPQRALRLFFLGIGLAKLLQASLDKAIWHSLKKMCYESSTLHHDALCANRMDARVQSCVLHCFRGLWSVLRGQGSRTACTPRAGNRGGSDCVSVASDSIGRRTMSLHC